MMDQSVDHLPRLHVPDSDRAVAGARDDDLVIILETQHGASVAGQHLGVLLQCLPVPHLDGVVPQSTHNLAVIILKCI